MASAPPGLDLATAPAEDPPNETSINGGEKDLEATLSNHPIWSYYAYYIGNNGLTLFNFAPTAFQNFLYQAAGDGDSLRFAGRERSINSIVLLSNGVGFAVQIVVFLFLGSFAGLSLVAWGIGFGWLGVHDPSKWQIATGIFPGLARNTPELRQKAEEYQTGDITREEYDYADSLKRSELSNMSFYIQSLGEIVILVGILFGLHVNASTANNNWGLSVLIAFEKRRAGQKVPLNMTIITVGFWQLYRALRQIWHLKQSLVYLIGYFLLGESLNTTVTVIGTLQNSIVSYNSLESTYLLIVGIATQAVGIHSFWFCQCRFHLSTKTMFNIVAFSIIILNCWGMIGIWTQTFGFHHVWEVWLYQVYYGLFVCPWYFYSQIMISEVTPRGREFLFFSLFSIIGKTSSCTWPLVSSAIIDASPSGNNSTPFYFLAGLSAVSFFMLGLFVYLKKGRKEQEEFLEREEAAKKAFVGQDIGVREEVVGDVKKGEDEEKQG
ncbi:related to autophagy protein (Atg22) [Phialocephala subalpina]|uniref:Autophagy-related protein n=1 Tax=Phialocephala subalpina TaxID=576137 RepID=A0A1L7XBW2_9HELO|nr:related to autophagy protein (Atg22) [Phialocephala subalpina]